MVMEPVPQIQVIVHQASPPKKNAIKMQLLSVPVEGEPMDGSGGGGCSSSLAINRREIGLVDEFGKPRRYSTNTPGRVGEVGAKHMSNSPNIRRRSSLAAIKWSSIARRFSHGMSSHEREPPEDPQKVRNHAYNSWRYALIRISIYNNSH